jgi:hypothetical protein
MRTRSSFLACAAIAAALAFAGCGAHNGVFGAPEYIAVVISPRVVSVPQGGTQTFSATVSNNLGVPTFTLLGSSDPTSPGTLTAVPGSPNSVVYTAPPAPPVYTSAKLQPGTVTIQANTTDPAGSMVAIVPDTLTFFITAPTITISLEPDTVTVPLGTSTQFTGYETGSANDGLTWEVNGLVGGLDAMGNPAGAGTITQGVTGGLYTAPATMPASGSSVTITMIPAANPGQSTQSFVTLQ